MIHASVNCLVLLRQAMLNALDFAFASAGKSSPARIAIMAITTSSSMSVKARRRGGRSGLFAHADNSDSGIKDLSQDMSHWARRKTYRVGLGSSIPPKTRYPVRLEAHKLWIP